MLFFAFINLMIKTNLYYLENVECKAYEFVEIISGGMNQILKFFY